MDTNQKNEKTKGQILKNIADVACNINTKAVEEKEKQLELLKPQFMPYVWEELEKCARTQGHNFIFSLEGIKNLPIFREDCDTLITIKFIRRELAKNEVHCSILHPTALQVLLE
jgi:hypothetical protein